MGLQFRIEPATASHHVTRQTLYRMSYAGLIGYALVANTKSTHLHHLSSGIGRFGDPGVGILLL